MERDDEVEDLQLRYDFVANILDTEAKKDGLYAEFLNLLEKEYMEYANKNDTLAEEAGALLKLQGVAAALQMIVVNPVVFSQKTVVAVAGEFSSGKSSFLNSLFKTRKVRLPTGIEPVTAISTYVMHGTDTKITGYSTDGASFDISPEIFKLFGHDKLHKFKFNLKTLISDISITNEFMENFESLCFIDTPGFESGEKSGVTDKEAAISSIANAAALIWCFNIESGTITKTSTSILQQICNKNPDIKIYIIAGKADLKSDSEIEDVIDTAADDLDDADIKFEGMMPYSSANSFSENETAYADFVKGKSLRQFLTSQNTKDDDKENELLMSVADVFKSYIQADETAIDETRQNLIKLKKIEHIFHEKSNNTVSLAKYEQLQREQLTGKFYDEAEYDDDIENDGEFISIVRTMQQECQNKIDKYEEDKKAAENISGKMQSCIKKIFGDSSSKKIDIGAVKYKKFCDVCGTTLNGTFKFCPKCGTSTFIK